MKKILLLPALFILAAGICISCKKETSCESYKENNKPPIAVAGPDQVITLPTDSISLDGSASNDPDGTISVWLWTKISGPASFNISFSATAKTLVKNLMPLQVFSPATQIEGNWLCFAKHKKIIGIGFG